MLDAGTGIRPLGLSLRELPDRIDLLLTHLHLDHVEGLGFFGPLFAPDVPITIWGPPQEGTPLAEWIAGYLSPPFFPRRFEELPSKIEFVELGEETWHLDGLKVTSSRVTTPGRRSAIGSKKKDARSPSSPTTSSGSRRTPAPSSPKAPTCSSTTRSTHRTSTAPASAGATRASTTSRRTSTR